MKPFKFLLAFVGVCCITSAASAQCPWTLCSEIDCFLQFELFVECPPNPPVSVSPITTTPPGCWGVPGFTTFNSTSCGPLSPPCDYVVQLNGRFYADGDIICCDPASRPEDCISCMCAYVRIDPTTNTVCLEAAKSGTTASGAVWNCP